MKKNLLILALSVLSTSLINAQAPEPEICCVPTRAKIFSVPITDVNAVNNEKEDVKFSGNGNIFNDVSLKLKDFIVFDGVQSIFPPLNLHNKQIAYTNGVFSFEYVSMTNGSTFVAYPNADVEFKTFIHNGKVRLVGFSGTRYRIGGRVYMVGDTVQGTDIVILPCTPQALPVVFGTISGNISSNKLTVNVQVDKETSNDHLTLAVSEDGQKFIDVASIKSLGDTDSSRTYTFQLDRSQLAGFGGVAGIVLAFLAICLLFGKKDKIAMGLLIVGISTFGVSCSKDTNDVDYTDYKYFHIKQVDKNGTVIKSSTFKFIN